jgi:hypothetical protein
MEWKNKERKKRGNENYIESWKKTKFTSKSRKTEQTSKGV